MQFEVKFVTRNLLSVAVVAGFLSVVPLSTAFAAEDPGASADQAEAQARQAWRYTMHDLVAPQSGCFHASFPSTQWEQVQCAAPPAYRSALPISKGVEGSTGNSFDYVAQAPSGHVFSSVFAGFPVVKGVKSEKGVGVALFGGGGDLGTNEYSLQINTDIHNSKACESYSHCKAWQQYVMVTNLKGYGEKQTGGSGVFIEYWLFNYGIHDGDKNICPRGYLDQGKDGSGPGDTCVQNSPAVLVYDGQIPITDLADLAFSGSAKKGGTDEATLFHGSDAYRASVKDSFTDISSVWSQAEFNVVGNGNGSRADFNGGSEIIVEILVKDGSSSAPKCVSPNAHDGTTGESNNLSLGQCLVRGGSSPGVEFVESN